MNGIKVKYWVSFRTARRSIANKEYLREESGPQNTTAPPCRAARLLALAHFVERKINAGEFRSQADAARRIGITEGRMTQVMNLLLLSPAIQPPALLEPLSTQ